MRTSLLLMCLCTLALGALGCQDTVTSTTDTTLGKISVEQFRAEPRYSVWFTPGYDAYPASTAQAQATFAQNVETIRNAFDSTRHSILMIVKPTCSCQKTQQTMPQVLKVLDAAGVPHSKIEIYVTDSRMAGFDDIKAHHEPAITTAPTFIVMKDGAEKGRIVENPSDGTTVEQMLAPFFAAP
jgi:hypothetical protein